MTQTRDKCLDTEYLEETCQSAPYSVIKTVRLKFAFVKDLLEDSLVGSNLQVLFLFRDPRSVMYRRWSQPWCITVDCYDTTAHCEQLEDDFWSYLKLKEEFPEQLHLMRFEDFVSEPSTEVERILSEMQMKYTDLVDVAIREQMESSKVGENHSLKDSESEKLPWAKSEKFTKSELTTVQKSCAAIMIKLGYNLVNKFINISSSDTIQRVGLSKWKNLHFLYSKIPIFSSSPFYVLFDFMLMELTIILEWTNGQFKQYFLMC